MYPWRKPKLPMEPIEMKDIAVVEGDFSQASGRYALAVSRFNGLITESLLQGAIDTLRRHGIPGEGITVVRVPGAFELPLVVRRLAASGRFDAVIALGAVIRGGTPHFDYVAGECASGLSRAALETGVPVTFGIITSDTIEQAIERAGTKAGNKGVDAALTAIEMVDLLKRLDSR